METIRRRRRGAGRFGTALGLGGLLALSGCGGGGAPLETSVTADGDSAVASGYEDVVAAVGSARIALCTPAGGGAYIPLPAPPGEAAAAAAYFRYLDGRIYMFGPCQVAPNQRNELRVFRYGDSGTRDAAIRDMARRNTRPTSAFAIGEAYEAQIWSPDPSLEGPVGQAAASVHVAISRVERARHLDVEPATVTTQGPAPACRATGTGESLRLEIAGFAYCPATLTVPAGVEVAWTNADLAPHTVTYEGPDGPVDSGSMAQGQSWSTRFDRPGTVRYYCRFHPGMTGTLVVG